MGIIAGWCYMCNNVQILDVWDLLIQGSQLMEVGGKKAEGADLGCNMPGKTRKSFSRRR